MTQVSAPRRASPCVRVWLALFPFLLAASAAGAQVRPDTVPRDTVPRDTVPRATLPADTVRPDTVRRDTAVVPVAPGTVERDTLPADSLMARAPRRVSPYPVFPRPRPVGYAFGSWEWDREALLRFHSLSVLDLVEQVPGITVTRVGDFGAPAGVSTGGAGGGRLRVFLDGFELDALGAGTVDLQRFGIGELESVRVERGPGEVRVELTTLRLKDPAPLATIEAAGGPYRVKALRAVFARPVGARSVFTAGYDAVSTRGYGFNSPFGVSGRRVGWSYALSRSTFLRADYRAEAVSRTFDPYRLDADWSALVVRGRSRLGRALEVDAMFGRERRTPDDGDTLTVTLSAYQGAARAALRTGYLDGEAGVRLRTGSMEDVAAPGLEVYGLATARPLPILALSGELRNASSGGAGGLSGSATARAGAATGPAVFATLSAGERPLALYSDTTYYDPVGPVGVTALQDTITTPRFHPVSTSVSQARVGAEWVRGEALVGVAAVATRAGSVVPFGLGFDPRLAVIDVDAARGLEARATLALPRTAGTVRLEGWYGYWAERGGRPYLPAHQGRAALSFHGLFYEGQLEPTFRVEMDARGSSLGPSPEDDTLTPVDAYALFNFFMQIRILDVRAFLISQNFANYRLASDVPGRPLPGNRLMWGVRWTFRG